MKEGIAGQEGFWERPGVPQPNATPLGDKISLVGWEERPGAGS